MCILLTQNICLMCHTQSLRLGDNQIGDAGLTALAKAVESGALASLEKLFLSKNQIGDVGITALADALEKGAMDKIQSISLLGNPGSSAPVDAALANRKK